MTNLLAARMQMAFSLGFHIVFAAIGMALPVMMVIAEWRWREERRSDPGRSRAAVGRRGRRSCSPWARCPAPSSRSSSACCGPASWSSPDPMIGLPFSLEGFAFFTEAIFLGVYLYGWDRISPRAHLAAGVLVALSAAPGHRLRRDGQRLDERPGGFAGRGRAARRRRSAPRHGEPGGVPAGAPHVARRIRGDGPRGRRHARAGCCDAARRPRSIVTRSRSRSGSACPPRCCSRCPATCARGWWRRRSRSSSRRWKASSRPRAERRSGSEGCRTRPPASTRGAIEIPCGLSLLAYHDADATVHGLNDFPEEDWPPVAVVHVSFQIMVALGPGDGRGELVGAVGRGATSDAGRASARSSSRSRWWRRWASSPSRPAGPSPRSGGSRGSSRD